MNIRTPGRAARASTLLGMLLSVVFLLGASAPASAETGQKALILGSSVSDFGGGSAEQQEAVGNGFTVDLVSDATWASMTAAQFADYQLVIVGDPTCGGTSPVIGQNAQALSDAVMARAGGNTKVGNRMLIGTDPVYHYTGGPTGELGKKLIETGIDFVGVQDGATNLYLTTSCFDSDSNGDGLGDVVERLLPKLTIDPAPNWTTQGAPCTGEASLISNVAQFSSLQSVNLKNWFCSAHIIYPTFPVDWTALAVSPDSPVQPTCGTDIDTGAAVCGAAHILIAGSGISVEAPNLQLAPPTATNPVGTTHTVTATVETNGGDPRPGVLVDFLVTGANAGAAGTCVPVNCTTDDAGAVRYTYTGANAGEDTINAAITVDGARQTATAAATWEARANADISIDDVSTLEGNSGTTPATFTVSLSAPATDAITVNYATSEGTATDPEDYAGAAGTVSFAAGEQSKQVTVDVKGDTIDESAEGYRVKLSGVKGPASIADGTGDGSIIDDDRNGAFTCRASPVRIGTIEPIIANAPNKPCADGTRRIALLDSTALGMGSLLRAGVANAVTDQNPDRLTDRAPQDGDTGRAHADVADVRLIVGLTVVTVRALSSDAAATCRDGSPTLSSASEVVGLRIGSAPATTVSGPTQIPLGLATLRLNQRTVAGGQVTQQALSLTSPVLPTVVLGESRAGVVGNPCAA